MNRVRLPIVPVSRSSVALFEEVGSDGEGRFVVERRPNKNGVANPGKLGFYGGHANYIKSPDGCRWESPIEAMLREMDEELCRRVSQLTVEHVGEIAVLAHYNNGGGSILRKVSQYLITIPPDLLEPTDEGGEIVRIEKTLVGVEKYKGDLTEYAYSTLVDYVKKTGLWAPKKGFWQ